MQETVIEIKTRDGKAKLRIFFFKKNNRLCLLCALTFVTGLMKIFFFNFPWFTLLPLDSTLLLHLEEYCTLTQCLSEGHREPHVLQRDSRREWSEA